MFLKLRPLLYSLIFLFGLEAIVFRHEIAFYLIIFLFISSIYHGLKMGKKWIFSILPVFFTISSAALLYLVTIPIEKQIFIGLSAILYYLALFGAFRLEQYSEDMTAKSMIMAASSAALFFIFSSAYGFYLNFLVPIYYLMLAYLGATFFISYQYFFIIKKNEKRIVFLYSAILSLLMAEIVWMLNYWPFGYLTTGCIALILYYILWELSRSHILNQLSRKRVVFNLVFFSFLIGSVLMSSKWMPMF